MRWIKWSLWNEDGSYDCGEMPLKNVQKTLQEFESKAKAALERTKADHVVYGVKELDDNSEVVAVRFYCHPMTEEEFEKRVADIPHQQVYALHARA